MTIKYRNSMSHTIKIMFDVNGRNVEKVTVHKGQVKDFDQYAFETRSKLAMVL